LRPAVEGAYIRASNGLVTRAVTGYIYSANWTIGQSALAGLSPARSSTSFIALTRRTRTRVQPRWDWCFGPFFVSISPLRYPQVQRLGKYDIISELGHGSMGSVYKARDPLIARLVALKTITSGLSTQAGLLDRFYQEARSAGALQHPNIVTIYELGHEMNTPFIAMEYVEGQSLDHIIEHQQLLPMSVKLGYIVRVCDALAYAHQHNVIHRDIKPANIMVSKNGVVKVVDFGIARLTDTSVTQPRMVLGSRSYMSPQLYKGERADARSDIWAVGVTLYELLTYRRPFTGDSEADLMYRIIYEEPPAVRTLLPECSAELAAIVARMLAKKSEERYQTMEDVLQALEPIWKTAQQATVAGLLVDCQALIAVNDLQRAQTLLRKALQVDIGNSQAKSMLDKVNVELRRTEVLPRINEHLNRAQLFLRSGQYREARSEVEAALGLDSKHETAIRFREEVEVAIAKVQQLEQKLRLTKQRLAEGALTEAAAALGQALELDGSNVQACELRRQIEEESKRREKRKQLSEILSRARTLWTELNYEECLSVLAAGLKEFPNEPELKKLEDSARADQADQQKQLRMGLIRKLLGQQNFSEARGMLDDLIKTFPQDTAIRNLQALAVEEEREQTRRKRLEEEMKTLRGFLVAGELEKIVAKGETLLQEYPEEYELKELVTYARSEFEQNEAKKKIETGEKQIRDLISAERYREAARRARLAVEEFPEHEIFHRLAGEAAALQKEQETREGIHQEMQRRIREISNRIQQDNVADAITLAEQTLTKYGPDPAVSQLLESAEQRKKQQEEVKNKISQVRTRIERGDYGGATRLFDQVMATQILKPNDHTVIELREKISALAETQKVVVAGQSTSVPSAASSLPKADKTVLSATRSTAEVIQPVRSASEIPVTKKEPRKKQETISLVRQKMLFLLHKPAALTTLGAAVLIVVILGARSLIVSGKPSTKDLKLKQQAEQLWQSKQFDQSEQVWKQLGQVKGPLQAEAVQQEKEIKRRRDEEQQMFEEAERLLNDKQCSQAQQAFQNLVQMNLWHASDAARDAELAGVCASQDDILKQERSMFDLAVQAFQDKDLERARREFLAMLDLNVPNSTLKTEAKGYLLKIQQTTVAQKLYEAAVDSVRNEHWTDAQNQLEEVIKHKSSQTELAKSLLPTVQKALQWENSIRKDIRAGAYRSAKNDMEAAPQWPKTRDALGEELHSAEQKEFASVQNICQNAAGSGDPTAIQHAQDTLNFFRGRAEDAALGSALQRLDQELNEAYTKALARQGDSGAFLLAVSHFEEARQKKDAEKLSHAVTQEFQKIAKGSGAYREQAEVYLKSTIPAAIGTLMKASGKILLPPISCSPSQRVPSIGGSVSCAQLDANAPLEWIGTPSMDLPDVANQPGKLPYTLDLIVTVDQQGNVKIDKLGDPDKAFFKKAKDASKQWRTTIPRSGGKPVAVRFLYSITAE